MRVDGALGRATDLLLIFSRVVDGVSVTKKMLSFVKDGRDGLTTHGAMLSCALCVACFFGVCSFSVGEAMLGGSDRRCRWQETGDDEVVFSFPRCPHGSSCCLGNSRQESWCKLKGARPLCTPVTFASTSLQLWRLELRWRCKIDGRPLLSNI